MGTASAKARSNPKVPEEPKGRPEAQEPGNGGGQAFSDPTGSGGRQNQGPGHVPQTSVTDEAPGWQSGPMWNILNLS